MAAPLLSATSLTKRFGAVHALRGVSLDLANGEIRAICGENGAGKSTLVKLLMGLYAPDSGTVAIDSAEVRIQGPQHAHRLGLALVAQELSLAPHLSVLDNIWLGSEEVPLFHRRAELRRRAAAALEKLNLDLDLDEPVYRLEVGQRQLVEIARLLTRDARILILDEPTATLSDVEIERLFGVLRSLRAEGRSVIYITHRLGEVFEICDSVTVLRNGEHIATSAVSAITRDTLIGDMLGRAIAEIYPPKRVSVHHGGLMVDSLRIPGAVERLSFEAPRGKITALAGQIGSGTTEVARALAGLVHNATGTVSFGDHPVPLGSAYSSRRAGIMFVSEDRAADGLFHRSVLENLVASDVGRFKHSGLLSWQRMRAGAEKLAELVGVDKGRLGADAFNLSGGNQQKVLFGRVSGAPNPGALIMNEPTRGVDVGARAEIYGLMRDFCRQGYALLMTSSDLEEVVGMADNVITLYRGQMISRYEDEDIDITKILSDITHPLSPAERAA